MKWSKEPQSQNEVVKGIPYQEFSIGQVIDNSSNFIDSHLRLIQNTLYVSFGATIILIVKRAQLTKKFVKVSEIPTAYFSKRISLRVNIEEISSDGILYVQHVPVIKASWVKKVFPFQTKETVDGRLPVKLIGLNFPKSHMKDAVTVLEQLKNKTVLAKLIYRDQSVEENDTNCDEVKPFCLHCLVYRPRVLYKTCVNYHLLRKGLVQVQPLPGALMDTKLSNKLFKAQKRAVFWRRGIWGKLKQNIDK